MCAWRGILSACNVYYGGFGVEDYMTLHAVAGAWNNVT